jgi:aspartyl-tRNA(Asn)/glutamyl-tRNA(Gln) amidotransferase subunit B
VTLSAAEVEVIRARLPELPNARLERLERDYGLSRYEAHLLTESRARADNNEAAVAPARAGDGATARKHAREVANWMIGELARLLNPSGLEIDDARVPPDHLYAMIGLIEDGTITGTVAKTVFEEMFRSGKPPADVVRELGLQQITGSDEIASAVDGVLAANPRPVSEYRAGKQEALKFLVGQAMRETRGRANPAALTEMLKARLQEAE